MRRFFPENVSLCEWTIQLRFFPVKDKDNSLKTPQAAKT